MRKGRRVSALFIPSAKSFIMAIALAAALFSYGCGGEEAPATTGIKPGTGISPEIMKTIQYDARVDVNNPGQEDGNTLVVNVTDEWVKDANYGSREWTMKGWYDKWQASRSGGGRAPEGLKVVARHNGTDVDRYSANGYEPLEKKKAN